MKPRSKFDKARAILLRDYPFWGSLVLNLMVEESTSISTMATDGIKIVYNPDYVEKQDLTVLITDIAHEGGHVGFLHPMRRGQRDPKVWNMATDFAINWHLKSSGLTLGDDYLYDPTYQDLDAEVIYNILWQNPEKQPEGTCGCGGLHDHPGTKTKGSGEPEKGQSVPSVGQSKAKMRTALAKARAFAKAAGKMPGSVDRVVEEILNPRICWEDVLQQFVERCGADDYTWMVPSRHHMHLGLYLPSLEDDQLSELVWVVDTSCSITGRIMDMIAAELTKSTSALPIEKIHIIYCDAAVQKVETYHKHDLPIKVRPVGGGGTDFRPPFEWLEKEGINPKGLIYLTDLCCSSFPEQPNYPVLWVVYGNKSKAPFGEVLKIPA